MLKEIDTVILDLGGVLLNVDYPGTARAFAELGHHDFDRLYSKARQNDLFNRFETGELDGAGFRKELRGLLGLELSDMQIDHCWNAMLGEIPPERIDAVKELRKRFQLLLLSNTNSIHVQAFTRIVMEKNGIEDLRELFDGAYFSNEMGARKPDTQIFLDILAQHEAIPERSLFIDDSPQHVEGARKAGLQAIHLDLAKEDLLGLLSRSGLLDRPVVRQLS